MKSKAALGVLAFCLGCLSLPAVADTLTLESATGGAVNGVDIYPYNFSINGNTTLTSLLCLNYNREITFGETWNVTKNSLALDDSQTSIDYRALALIEYTISAGGSGISASDLQFADWAIFDPADMASNSGYTASADSIRQEALLEASNSALTNSGFYSNFVLYSPTSDTTGWTAGIPQEFLGNVTTPVISTVPPLSPVPEPSTLMLAGTGILGLAGAVRRKLVRS